jgi:Fur family ferric uptake transcriptional regulator
VNYATRQRQAVQKTLDDAARPLTPAEIWQVARTYSPGLGIATVYRALRILIDMGAVEVVEIPGAPPHYERKHPHHHHHFLCDSCQKVYEIEACTDGIDQLAPSGYIVKRHSLTLYGTCPECAASGATVTA